MNTKPMRRPGNRLSFLIALALFATSIKAHDNLVASGKLTSGGRERSYSLYLPASLNRAKPAPVLFVFHGAGGNGASDLGMYRHLADREQFLLVGPDGINKRWNAGNSEEIKATDGADDVGFVRDLVREIALHYNADTNRVYAAGFSNGGALCHRLAAEMPEIFAAVAGTGATMAKVTRPLLKTGPPIAMQMMVGTEDGMFGRAGDLRGGTFLTADETAAIWANHNGCGESVRVESPVLFRRWPGKTPANGDVELWIVEGVGHTPSLGGEKWSTAEQQWRFFSRHIRAQ